LAARLALSDIAALGRGAEGIAPARGLAEIEASDYRELPAFLWLGGHECVMWAKNDKTPAVEVSAGASLPPGTSKKA